MERWSLPEGWERRMLATLVSIKYGRALKKEDRKEHGAFCVYGSNGVVGRHTVSLTQGSTIIIGRKGSTGAVHFSLEPCWPIDTTFYIDDFPSFVFPAYLSYFLGYQRLEQLNIHAAIPGLRREDLERIPIPLPYPDDPARSLETQRRIVRRLDALLAEAAAARRLHAEIAEDAAQVMEAVLREVFPDPFRKPPTGWTVKTVGEISKRTQYGYTQSAKSEPIGPKFLRITDIQNVQVDWTAVPHCEITGRDLTRYRLQDRDIVFARSGASTGKTFLVRNPPEAVFASYLIRIQIIRHSIPDFVYWFFQSPYYWSQIAPRGGAQPNMNAQALRQIAVPLPLDISVQNRIVNYLRSIQEEIIELCTIQERKENLLDQVEQTILAHAFCGEL